jgi:hypothetical protein
MRTTLLTLLVLSIIFTTTKVSAQSGPWAKYDQELKDGALYREASAGNLSEVKSIVQGGGNVHYVSTQTKYTILMAAAGSGKIEVVQYLLDLGVDPMAKDWWDQTALDKARSVGAKDIEALLLKAMNKKTPAPKPDPKPAPKPVPDKNPKPTPQPEITKESFPNKWPSFGTYKTGDQIIYFVPGGWRKGTIKEVGTSTATGKVSVDYKLKKYMVDAGVLGSDWYEWSGVVKPERKPFWTAWFIGEWQIGEVQAHSNEIKNGKETDTYYYLDAKEKLNVYPNNTYRWKLTDGKIKTGKWKANPNEPGIILVNAYRNLDWTLRNSTTVDDWKIRKLDMINLKPSANVMSINGRRKTSE